MDCFSWVLGLFVPDLKVRRVWGHLDGFPRIPKLTGPILVRSRALMIWKILLVRDIAVPGYIISV